MKKKPLFIVFATLLITSFLLSIMTKWNFFMFASALSPMLFVFASQKDKRANIFLALSLLGVNAGYLLFANYMNNPWFMDDPNNCDGPCFGWYSFEKSLIPNIIWLNIIFAISLIIAFFVKRKSNPS